MSVVKFDLNVFKKAYPNIKASDEQLEMFFVEATLFLNNTKDSCITDLKQREVLLYLLVAHIATLQNRIDEGNEAVGRVGSASEGSVSVSFDYGQSSNNAAWYQQTPYGAKYWALTSRYRSFLYTITQLPMPVQR